MPTSALPTPRQLLPEPAFAEYHHRRLDAAPDAAGRALHAITCREVRLLAPLMAVRQLPVLLTGRRLLPGGDLPLEETFRHGFDVLASQPLGYLFVGVQQPFKLRSGERRPVGCAEEFRAFDEPGFCRIVGDLRVTVRDGTTVVSTETLVDCTDPDTLRAFRRYWRVIRPFSGLIRHSMLAAVRRRAGAARPAPPTPQAGRGPTIA